MTIPLDRDTLRARAAVSSPPTGAISSFLRFSRSGRQRFMELAREAISVDPKLAPILADWDRMKSSLQKAVDLDALCEAHGVDPSHLVALVGEASLRFHGDASNLITILNMPAVVAKCIERALTPEGIADRRLILEYTGFLPVPKRRILNSAAIKALMDKGQIGKPLPYVR